MTNPTLTYAWVQSDKSQVEKCFLFLHGIFGAGGNMRGLARQLVEEKPHWGVALVDLRMHGSSQGFRGPHTLDACADDLSTLSQSLPVPVCGVVGHSFGGKVAMGYAQMTKLEQVWILDSTPSARPDQRGSEIVMAVLRACENGPESYDTREQFADYLRGHGIDAKIAAWLGMNLVRDGHAYKLRLDLAAIRELLEDYWCRDDWGLVEDEARSGNWHFVIGGKSQVLDSHDRDRLEALAQASSGSLASHTLLHSGHWVHVDDPEGLRRLLLAFVP
jgi:pimeloyl-ACP methyl ester carboxylesterase